MRKKAGYSGSHLSSQLSGKQKIGESQLKPAWAKTKSLSPKLPEQKGYGSSSRVPACKHKVPKFKHQYHKK
jgi:hypothetical protein